MENPKFPCSFRYHLSITINKADVRGKILQRMSSGTIIIFKTLEEARMAQLEFIALSDYTTSLSTFSNYGLTCIIDEEQNTIHYSTPIGI